MSGTADPVSADYDKEEVPVTGQTSAAVRTRPWHAKVSRRRFLGTGAALAGAAAAAGYLPESVLRAAETSAADRSPFDLSQVKHLVFLMKENRSFDHYFGTYPGVRGFADPHAIKLPNGNSVFQQPDPANPDGYLEPFRLDTINTGAAAIPDLNHGWQAQHASWNFGRMDAWLRTHIAADGPRNGPYTMGYHTQEDIPFHWALAQTFTLCDRYHCSVLGPTFPNRLMWSTGSIDPLGLAGGPVIETVNRMDLTYETGAETMYKAGISVKQYNCDGRFDEEGACWFLFSQVWNNTLPRALLNRIRTGFTDFLYGDGTPGGIGDPLHPIAPAVRLKAFQQDCANGVLPDVSFIGNTVAVNSSTNTSAGDEHPPGLPAVGAQLTAQYLDALASNEDLWNTTVFVIQWDENDGFFDHVPPPVPDPDQFPEEFVTRASTQGTPGGGLPVGAGFRVPCIIVSPWSVGGRIFSEVSDHTSCLRLIEAVAAAGGLSGRGPVTFPLISRWRRQTFSDLTGALSGPAQPAQSNPEFDPVTRATNVAEQQASAKLPLPPFPGADQTMPVPPKKLPG
ncbi:MAG: twin-arginine translocation signal domain-containing protein [Micromonosporaceae bacterium]|nr:twin-arginine translocation signal domain-containing protein [Micromonosporaceae bacterium]